MAKKRNPDPTSHTPPAATSAASAQRGEGGELQPQATGDSPVLTTRLGMALEDNQNSLRVAPRGPLVLADPVLLDKLAHFHRERIPERVVHARASAAHGHFVLTRSLAPYTTARVLTEVGRKTPVFARLSTVAGPAGSADTVRDVRGFAVKFYTDEGNWDLVGNNIPVFFIQDAMKFPDLVHAVKREPDRGFPSAASAHDTFWDFISLMPEALHMVLWVMSDRALPRSLRMMDGFGVHTFRLVDAAGQATFVKYHWRPVAGVQSLLWDEAVKIAGADPDYHRRDLWESIAAGQFPAWDLAVQLIPEAQAERLPVDLLDPTKLVPEELVPLQVIGRMTLDRNPDNFFAENEQAAFSPANIVPGMDFSEDPLLLGRVMSYGDSQRHRLGGANFDRLPVNRPRCPVHHFQRDGQHETERPTGRVAYEPNSLAPASPRASAALGQRSAATAPAEGPRGRRRPASFADHYSQARQFYASQTPVEQGHIVDALVFELSKVETPAVRHRVVGHLRVIDEALAAGVSAGLGLAELPAPADPALAPATLPLSPVLSIQARGPNPLAGRCVGLLLAEGSDAAVVAATVAAVEKAGARVQRIAPTIEGVVLSDGQRLPVDAQLEGAPSVLFDAVALVLAPEAAAQLAEVPAAQAFLRDAFTHLKAIGHDPGAADLLAAAGVPEDDFVVPLSDRKRFLDCAASRCWARA